MLTLQYLTALPNNGLILSREDLGQQRSGRILGNKEKEKSEGESKGIATERESKGADFTGCH